MYLIDNHKKTLRQLTLQNLGKPITFSDINNDDRFIVPKSITSLFPNARSGISIAIVARSDRESGSESKIPDMSEKRNHHASTKNIQDQNTSVLGRLFVYFADQHDFPEDELLFFHHVTDVLAEAILRCKTERKLSESNERFRFNYTK